MNRSYSNHSGRIVAVDLPSRTITLEEVARCDEPRPRRRSFELRGCRVHASPGDWVSVTAEHVDGRSVAHIIARFDPERANRRPLVLVRSQPRITREG